MSQRDEERRETGGEEDKQYGLKRRQRRERERFRAEFMMEGRWGQTEKG